MLESLELLFSTEMEDTQDLRCKLSLLDDPVQHRRVAKCAPFVLLVDTTLTHALSHESYSVTRQPGQLKVVWTVIVYYSVDEKEESSVCALLCMVATAKSMSRQVVGAHPQDRMLRSVVAIADVFLYRSVRCNICQAYEELSEVST